MFDFGGKFEIGRFLKTKFMSKGRNNHQRLKIDLPLKFMFSKKSTKNYEIFTVDLTFT